MKKYDHFLGASGGIFLLTGWILYFVTANLSRLTILFLIIGGLFILAYAFVNLKKFISYASTRSAKFTSNAIITALTVFGILVFVNLISTRHYIRIDTTSAKRFSLSPQTKSIVSALDQELRIIAFYQSAAHERTAKAQDVFKEYAHLSDKIHFEFIDPDHHPAVAKNYGIKNYGTVVVEYGDRTETFNTIDEETITNALLKVTRDTQKIIYFLTGHGEKDINVTDRTGYSSIREIVKRENYLVESLLLADKSAIPHDCAVLVIAGPSKQLLPNETQMIETYLQRGGKVFFLLDPAPQASMAEFLDNWGVEVADYVVVDASGFGKLFGTGPEIPLVMSYSHHDITKGFGSNMTAFSLVRPINVKKDKDKNITLTVLARTQPKSWAEKNYHRSRAQFDPDEDLRGPVTIALAGTQDINATNGADPVGTVKAPQTRFVVLGDSDFASNRFYKFQGNTDFFMNALNWLAEEDDLVSIRPKNPEERRLIITESQSKIILIFAVILLPLFLLSAGIVVYIKRK